VTARARPLAAFATLLLLDPGCRSVELTPAAVERALVEAPAPARAAATWREAVALANEFLASAQRRTLPEGRFELSEGAGMRFLTSAGAWPITVCCTSWGDVCVAFGFAAQEREWGFVVGSKEPERDRLVDNSLFVGPGGFRLTAGDVARLILHETTHVVWREGTVGFWNGVSYYLESIFLFRYSNHSDERRPNATDEEFDWFVNERALRATGDATVLAKFHAYVERHLGEAHDTCRHGPFEEAPPAPPEPARPSPSQDPQ
jgi:hypothetical protein